MRGGRRRRTEGGAAERVRRARREGVVPHSPLFVAALLCAAVLAALGALAEVLLAVVRRAAEAPASTQAMAGEELARALWSDLAVPVLRPLAVLLALCWLGAWLLGALQVGPRLALRARPRRRLTPRPARVEALGALTLLLLLAGFAWLATPELARLAAATRAWGPGVALASLRFGGLVVAAAAAIAGVVDALARRAAWRNAVERAKGTR